MRTFLIILVVVLLLVVARFSVFTVGPTEYVYLTQFGKHLKTFDGAETNKDAGLHFRMPWPIQSVQRIDRRLQYFDLPATEVLTLDAKNKKDIDKMLIVEAYVCWKIADVAEVDTFIRRIGTTERAEDILGQRINSQIGAAFGNTSLNDIISTEATKADDNMRRFYDSILAKIRPAFREEYGVDLVDIRLRRFYYPEQNRASLFDKIRSERHKKAEIERSKGRTEAQKISDDANYNYKVAILEAKKYEKETKTEADTMALKIREEAYAKDREFSVFLKKLENQKTILGNNDAFLYLSFPHPLFDLLNPPAVKKSMEKSEK